MTELCDNGLSLKDDIASIRTDPIFHDVVIVCADDVKVGACRAILASRCPFFKAMLYGNTQESTSHSITLQNITSTAMAAVLCFIHMEDIDSIEDSVVVELYLAANYLLLPKLKKLVLRRVECNRNFETATLLLNKGVELAPWTENTKDLYNVLLKLFCTQPLTIGNIKGLSGEALEVLLTHTMTREFKTSEYDLFLCVAEWAWARDNTAPSADDRRATCDAIKNLSVATNIDPKILHGNGPSGTPLLRMFRHLDLALIRPYLKPGAKAIDVLSESVEFSQPESDVYGFPQHGYFFIRSLVNKKIFDICGGVPDPGRRIQVWPQPLSNSNCDTELWSYENGFIISKASGLVIDVQLEPGRNICQYNRKKDNGYNNQLWALDNEGFIYCISNPEFVLGVRQADDWDGADIFLYTRKSEDNLNQKWEIVMVE